MVIFCIGTPQISGDSVAPLVGDMLIEEGVDAYVYGTTQNPISGKNYDEYYSFVTAMHPHQPIIAVDAALGVPSDIGKIKVLQGGVRPGKAVGKELTPIGTISILAQVGEHSAAPQQELMSVPFNQAIRMARRCADIIKALVQPAV